MEKTGNGDGQRATAGNRLALPFSALVTASDGAGVPRVGLKWAVVQGEGAVLSDSLTVTDGVGVAHAFLTLGPAAGDYVVEASLVDKPDAILTFTAQAVPAPTLTGVEPQTFSSGDELLLTGSALSDSVEIEIGGKVATVNLISLSGQGLTVTVPSCLAPGEVEIVARVGISMSDPITGTYEADSRPLDLARGQYTSIEPAALEGCATFGAAFGQFGPEPREYLMAVHSVTDFWGEVLPFRFVGDTSAPPVTLADAASGDRKLADLFHDRMRSLEAELAELPRQPMEVVNPPMAPAASDPKIGDRRAFRVCDKVTCSAVEDFAAVTAEAKYVGDHAVLYQDLEAPPGFGEQDFLEMGELFDAELYEVATRAFGSESDVDLDGRMQILLTPIVNGLTEEAQCDESFITGFFFPIDIDPIYANDERSNQAEIFYSMVPDPDGTVTCDHTVRKVKRLVPITFIHELQHMINFSQHVLVRAGRSERTWLNESMSHIAEELAAVHFEALGNEERFNDFAINNLFNSYKYLEDPEQHSLMYRTGSGTIEERGAGWLFLRWVADKFGEDILRQLSETDLVGTENVMTATGEPMARMLADWFLANYVSDNPALASVPDRLEYDSWDLRRAFASLHAQDPALFEGEFPLEPAVFSGGDFDVSGTMRSGSGAYFLVTQTPGGRGFSVELLDDLGEPLAGAAAPRLTVIRIR
jgi:hypothetical protein